MPLPPSSPTFRCCLLACLLRTRVNSRSSALSGDAVATATPLRAAPRSLPTTACLSSVVSSVCLGMQPPWPLVSTSPSLSSLRISLRGRSWRHLVLDVHSQKLLID